MKLIIDILFLISIQYLYLIYGCRVEMTRYHFIYFFLFILEPWSSADINLHQILFSLKENMGLHTFTQKSLTLQI